SSVGDEAGAAQTADGAAAPDGSRRVQSLDVEPLAQDYAAAQEPEAADDIGSDTRRTGRVVHQQRQRHEQGGPEGDQGVGAQPGGVLPPLALQPDGDTHPQRRGAVADEGPVIQHSVTPLPVPNVADREERRQSATSRRVQSMNSQVTADSAHMT